MSKPIKEASVRLEVPNFSQFVSGCKETDLRWDTYTVYFGIVPHDQFKNLTLDPGSLFKDDMIIYLYINILKSKTTFKYSVSILNASGEKCYTQKYYFAYNKPTPGKVNHHFAKFIPRDELLNAANGYLIDDKLTLLYEVKVFDDVIGKKTSFDLTMSLNHLGKDWLVPLEQQKNTDVVLVASGKEFPAHKLVLATRSPVFGAMFEHKDTKESLEGRVEIPDMTQETMESFLKYIYSGNVETLDKDALDLLIASEKYQMEHLKSVCAQYLSANLSEDSVASILLVADLNQAQDLKQHCFDYITSSDHLNGVQQSEGWKALVTKPELLVELLKLTNNKLYKK